MKFYGQVSPNAIGQVVYLQQLIGTSWRNTVFTAKVAYQVMPNGHRVVSYIVTLKTSTKGSYRYRIYKPATATNAAGYSKPVGLKVT